MSNLLGAVEIREIAERIGVKPTKKLGQNFVHDANTCRKIVAAAGVSESDVALEIGPGLGSLTLALLEKAKEVVVVEIDNRLAAELPATAQRHGFTESKLTVVNQDALEVSTLPKQPTVLVANLPYNVSVPVLLRFLELFPSIKSGIVMVQSEVADRLIAKPNSKDYGSPSVKCNWWADMSSGGTVSRSIFWPVPNVDSALVKFVRHQNPGDETLRRTTFKVIDAAFAKRRKMLRAALSGIATEEQIQNSGVDPQVRGEILDLNDFMKIAVTISK
jgi:16S rRNA (adenine1518-N6/adenine1519-N6)-dimethyltransferase